MPLEFRDIFVNRMSKLQSERRMLKAEEITTEAESVAYEIQLEMVYEYTSRQLGMPWSFEKEFDYGWGKTILASEVLSREAFETYRHLIGSPENNAEDKDFLYEYARLTGGNPEQIMAELREGGWIDESEPGVIKNNRPESIIRIKDFWED